MAVDLDGRGGDLPGSVQDEAIGIIKSLIGVNIDRLPRKLHLHQLVNRSVPSALNSKKKEPVWSLHITADDRYKASFTYEDGTLYFRTCGIHDTVDKHP